jgi:uncharacterized protein
MDDISSLRRILKDNQTIAVVGLSANWWRPSYFAAKYMQEHGYRVVPVNPAYEEVLGEKCYASLKDNRPFGRRSHRHWCQMPLDAARCDQ